jgi:hypothetical protein
MSSRWWEMHEYVFWMSSRPDWLNNRLYRSERRGKVKNFRA